MMSRQQVEQLREGLVAELAELKLREAGRLATDRAFGSRARPAFNPDPETAQRVILQLEASIDVLGMVLGDNRQHGEIIEGQVVQPTPPGARAPALHPPPRGLPRPDEDDDR